MTYSPQYIDFWIPVHAKLPGPYSVTMRVLSYDLAGIICDESSVARRTINIVFLRFTLKLKIAQFFEFLFSNLRTRLNLCCIQTFNTCLNNILVHTYN